MTNMSGLMKGKRGIILGVANNRSIAFGIARACRAAGAELALTWQGEGSIFGIVTPNATETWLLLAIGVLGTCGHLLMTWSLRFAPSATVAPVQYLEIPCATFIGWLVFADLPNGLAAIGIAITMAAGLYILARERMLAQPRPSEA